MDDPNFMQFQPCIFLGVTAYFQWHVPFSLIGHHLESAKRTEMVVELDLALSETEPTCPFWERLDNFLSSYRVSVASCTCCAMAQVKVRIQLNIDKSAMAKYNSIASSPNLVILHSTVTELFIKVRQKRSRSQKGHVRSHQGQSMKNQRGRERERERERGGGENKHDRAYTIRKRPKTKTPRTSGGCVITRLIIIIACTL